jgi:signal transduction histidine kinase
VSTYDHGVRRLPRLDRVLVTVLVAVTLAGLAFAAAVVPGASVIAMAAGVLAQLAATAVVTFLPARPHLGFAAVLVVAAGMRLVDSPWQRLVAEQAVVWLPVAVAWATIRVVSGARTPAQHRVSAVLALAYLAVAGVGDGIGGVLGASVPLLGGVCASLAGRLRQARRDRVAELALRARHEERQRVAATVHDTLGHVLTLLVLQANHLTGSADPAARAAGERMSGLGNQGLTELRRILTLLDPPAEAARVPVTAPVEELVAQAQAAGQDVTLSVTAPVPSLGPATASAVTRTVQEGLTNARRHAPGAAVAVSLAVDGGTVRVAVRNAAGEAVGESGSGRGLAALGRRVTMLGGECRHARTDDGGYALDVELPG